MNPIVRERLDELADDAGRELALVDVEERPEAIHRFVLRMQAEIAQALGHHEQQAAA